MPLVERNYEVQTVSPYSPDQSLTEGIRLGRLWRSFQDRQSEPLYQFLIELSRENGVTVMDGEAIVLASAAMQLSPRERMRITTKASKAVAVTRKKKAKQKKNAARK